MSARSAGLALWLIATMVAASPGEVRSFPPAEQNFLLNCAGCHGFDGTSNVRLVPDLHGKVGFFLSLPEGRRYLARLPNVAISTLSNQELAAVLNYVAFTLGGESAPKGAKPFTAAEVGQLRKQPLNEVQLFNYRERLVETLIADYQAPAELRIYGQDMYGPKAPH